MDDRYAGAMLGLALGDALGAFHEGGILGGLLWIAAGGTAGGALRWTDDTEMAMGLAESLLARGGVDPDDLAGRWARNMGSMRGYGPGASKLLALIRRGADWREANRAVFPEGSFGNGAAMRAVPLGLFYRSRPAELGQAAALAARVTHAHPLGVEGGVLIARAAALALDESLSPRALLESLESRAHSPEYGRRLRWAREALDRDPALGEVRESLGRSVLAHESAVTAVYAFCRLPTDFSALTDFVIKLGGDTDTIGAMAGGLFGARNGIAALPPEPLGRLEERARLEGLGRALFKAQGA